MTILRRAHPVQVVQVIPLRLTRTSCPRCGTVNCGRHSAATLTNGSIPQQWRMP